ncbi:MAG TPA: hypothetical protein VEA15_02570 [Caulobacteraceae bacterium]|nr:hypothetical protein [Caulobacteraceae bacterium]
MSDPRDPSAAEPDEPGPGLPDDERPVPSDPPAPADFASRDYDLGPDPWDPGAPPPAPAATPPPPAPRPAPVESAPPHHTREYGAGAPPEAFAAGEADHHVKRPAFAVYLLFLGTFILLIPAVVGVIIAYRARRSSQGWLQSHYVFQIRTFWISTAAMAATLLGFLIGFGPVLFMALVVWVTLRCFVGMVRLHRGEPIYNPQTWIV